MEIRHADLQIEVEDAEDGGVLLTIIDSARLSLSLPLFGMHVGIDGASWTCGAVRSRDVDGLADELEALLE